MPITDDQLLQQATELQAQSSKLLPQSTQELATGAATVPSGPMLGTRPSAPDTERKRLEQLGAKPGVPFHQEGLPTWMDLMVKARKNSEDQLNYLARQVGPENVRLNARNEPVVSIVNPKTGQKEDYPVNPHELTMDSITGLAALLPEVAGSALALRMGGAGRGLLAESLLGALGAEAGGAAKQLVTEAEEESKGGPPASSVSKVVGQNLQNLPMDAALNLGIGVGVKGLQTAGRVLTGNPPPNPLAGTKLLQPANPAFTQEVTGAARRLESASGIAPELTPAATTGIPVVAQAQQYMLSKAAGASAMEKAQVRRENASLAIQNWMVDPTTLGTDEEVGRQGLAVLSKPVVALKEQIRQAKQRLGLAGELDAATLEVAKNEAIAEQQQSLVKALKATDIPVEGVLKTETGGLLQNKALADRAASEANYKNLYDVFDSNPNSSARVLVEGGNLKNSIDSYVGTLPAVEKTVQQPTGMVNQYGKPIMRQAVVNEPIGTPVRQRLEDLSEKLASGRVSIQDLKQVRTDVGNDITRGEAVGETVDKRLKGLYAKLSTAMEDGLKQINDPALTKAFEDANAAFKAHAQKFTEKTVAPFFREADQAGSLGHARFVENLQRSPDAYVAMTKFFGANSPEVAAFHKTVRDSLLEDSLAAGNSVSGDALVRALTGLRKNNPQLFKDALGGTGKTLIDSAETLGKFQGSLPLDEVAKLLTSRNPVTRADLMRLQDSEKQLAAAYHNRVTKKFLSGDMEAAQLEPDEFVRFLPTAKVSDVQQVMAKLRAEAPDVAEQVERKTIQSLLQQSRTRVLPRHILQQIQGQPGDLISAPGLATALFGKGADQLAKYKTLLGARFNTLIDYAKMELGEEESRRVGGGAGMLAKGQDVHAFEQAIMHTLLPLPGDTKKGSMLKELGNLGRTKAFSVILASPKLSTWLLSPERLQDMPRTIQTLMSSEPFVRGMIQEFGSPGAAYKAIATIRAGLPNQRTQGGMSDDDLLKQAQQLQPAKP